MAISMSKTGVLHVYRFRAENGREPDLMNQWASVETALVDEIKRYAKPRPLVAEDYALEFLTGDLHYASEFVLLGWSKTTRKIPKSELERNIQIRLSGLGLEKVPRALRSEIKEMVQRELMEKALPDKRMFVAGMDRGTGTLYIQGCNAKAADKFAAVLSNVFLSAGLTLEGPRSVLRSLPLPLIDALATRAREAGKFDLLTVTMGASAATLTDQSGEIRVSSGGDFDTLIDIELMVREQRHIGGFTLSSLAADNPICHYRLAIDKTAVLSLDELDTDLSVQFLSVVRAWDWFYALCHDTLNHVRLADDDREALLCPWTKKPVSTPTTPNHVPPIPSLS